MNPTASGQYAPINGLQMYYEIHGSGQPLVLLHGSFSAIGTSFGMLWPELAKTRQVIAVDMQAHGRTGDIDRPLRINLLADDVSALLRYLKIEKADVLGYSAGAGVAIQTALAYPEQVRKLVLVSLSVSKSGFHPGMMEGFDQMKPEMLAGTPWHEEYMRIAPQPENFPALVAKIIDLNHHLPDWTAEQVRALQPPTLVMVADSDIVRPEHAVEMFRLLGGGVAGEMAGMPKSQLAIIPGAAHSTIVSRAELLVPMVRRFLDAPDP